MLRMGRASAFFLRHWYGVVAEKCFRSNTFSGCDRSVSPSRRVDKVFGHVESHVYKSRA